MSRENVCPFEPGRSRGNVLCPFRPIESQFCPCSAIPRCVRSFFHMEGPILRHIVDTLMGNFNVKEWVRFPIRNNGPELHYRLDKAVANDGENDDAREIECECGNVVMLRNAIEELRGGGDGGEGGADGKHGGGSGSEGERVGGGIVPPPVGLRPARPQGWRSREGKRWRVPPQP